ncbi:MAG: hypothetical protein QM790_14385 [Nibricoccus sp.]
MNSHSNKGPLNQLLRANWQVEPVKNPAFRAEVWARIEANRRAPSTWSAWLRVNALRFASAAAACVIIASVGGGWIATARASQEREQLVQRYLASIDPHQHTDPSAR